MTAERWWVRVAARWLARIRGVEGQLRLAMLGLTGVSTASLTLKQYGYGQYALPLVAMTGVGSLVFAYYYTEGGVWNQASRDQIDLSTNFSGPSMFMEKQIQRAQFAFLISRLTDQDFEDVNADLQELTAEQWAEYRDGIPIDDE